jgi:hypothetical protein
MIKILTIAGQAEVIFILVCGFICRVSKAARAVRNELKRWKRSSKRRSGCKKPS